jgi:hypothetical protein
VKPRNKRARIKFYWEEKPYIMQLVDQVVSIMPGVNPKKQNGHPVRVIIWISKMVAKTFDLDNSILTLPLQRKHHGKKESFQLSARFQSLALPTQRVLSEDTAQICTY